MFYLTTFSTHFIYGYMASDIWLRTILIVRKETSCRHIGYSYQLTARVLLYAPSHRQDNTHHCLCYTSRGALAGTRNTYICNHAHALLVCAYMTSKELSEARRECYGRYHKSHQARINKTTEIKTKYYIWVSYNYLTTHSTHFYPWLYSCHKFI